MSVDLKNGEIAIVVLTPGNVANDIVITYKGTTETITPVLIDGVFDAQATLTAHTIQNESIVAAQVIEGRVCLFYLSDRARHLTTASNPVISQDTVTAAGLATSGFANFATTRMVSAMIDKMNESHRLELSVMKTMSKTSSLLDHGLS